MAKGLESAVSPSSPLSRSILFRCCIVLISLLFLIYRYADIQHTFHTLAAPKDDSSTYEGESLDWKDCGMIAGRRLECSQITVPVDHFQPEHSPQLSFELPLIRLRGRNGSKNLFVSPGGPGVSGVNFLHNRAVLFDEVVGDHFHIVAFDARGVNEAKPAALCYATRANKARLSTSPIKSIEQSTEAYEWTKGFVKSCQDITGEHGPYINTPQIAADMNMILKALGQDNIYYWGISWGSVLGQTYASLYPSKAGRVIVDGVVNSTSWFDNRLAESGSLNDAERVLYGFFEECIKAGFRCPLSNFADTAAGLQDLVMNLIKQLQKPISVYVDSDHWGLLHGDDLLYNGLFGALYSPASWWSTAHNLAQLLKGNVTEAFLAWGGQGPYDDWMTDESLHFISNNDQATGSANWPQDREEFLDLVRPALNETIFSPALHLEIYKRQQWPLRKTHNFRQPRKVKTAQPMLVMSTAWDPVTPFAATKSALDTFEGSRLVKLMGYGHTTFAMPSKCIFKHVRAYLFNDTLPDQNATCQVDGKYFTEPTTSHA